MLPRTVRNNVELSHCNFTERQKWRKPTTEDRLERPY